MLIKKSWWWEADYADTVRDSIRRYSASPELAERLLAGSEDDGDDYDDPEPISDARPFR
ncbi:hypothetical protein GTA09_21470 [Rhodococcus hoagii]|nr:hypothetical protein [Prescottella equi]NKZ71996.1 hypothetical protein [Prescottella equi]